MGGEVGLSGCGSEAFESLGECVVILVDVDSRCFECPVPECSADENHVFGSAVQSGSEGVSCRVDREPGSRDACPLDPELESCLDLPSGYPGSSVGEEQGGVVCLHFASVSQVSLDR